MSQTSQSAVRKPNRIPPHDLDAEQSVLGAMMESRDAIANVVGIVRAQDFYKPAHVYVYEAIVSLYAAGEPSDAVTVADELQRRGTLETVGGRPYLLGLLEAYPTASAAPTYARIVSQHSLCRRLISAGNRIQELGFNPGDDPDAVLREAEEQLYQVQQGGGQREMVPVSEILTEHLATIEERAATGGAGVTGVSSGFSDLDRLTSGFQPATFTVVAARPSQGKSSLLGDFALNVALNAKAPVALFSLEMSRHELVERFLASQAKVDSQRIHRGALEDRDWTRLSSALGRLSSAPIYIDDSGSTTVTDVRAKCRRLQTKVGLGLVIVDYLQLMPSSDKPENRQLEVSAISRGLKLLAKDLKVPVICAAQVNRAVEYRSDKRPLMADLRESGQIEAEADVVMFIYRDEVYNPETEAKGEAEVIVAKHRNGPTGTVRLAFLNHYATFASLARGEATL